MQGVGAGCFPLPPASRILNPQLIKHSKQGHS